MTIRARHRRRFHFGVFVAALIPGGIMSLLYPRMVFMSWVAFWYAPLSAFAAETPVEEES